MSEFEDKYADVLQNIEWSLLKTTRDHPELCDHDMLRVLEHVLLFYKNRQNSSIKNTLNQLNQEIFDTVIAICEFRLGKNISTSKITSVKPITLEELFLCLKRIEKSINFWTKNGGRKGYINFASPYALI